MIGFYYLHKNGRLVWNDEKTLDESPFVIRCWPVDTDSDASLWIVLLEATYLNANWLALYDFVYQYNLDKFSFIKSMKFIEPTEERKIGAQIIQKEILNVSAKELLDELAREKLTLKMIEENKNGS